jgi:hypothetical protein
MKSEVVRGLLPGFEPAVRCVVKDVGEFRLVELVDGQRAVEYSKEVQEAFDQAFYRVSDARDRITKPQDRVRLSRALFHLFLEVRHGASAGGFGFAPKIAETLGRMIVEAMQANDVEVAINGCASRFKAALRGIASANSVLTHKRGSWLRPEAEAIIEGQTIFLETGERPTKSAIRALMERHGITFSKKRARAKWREIFARAALQNLED